MLDREEYVEQAYLFRALGERLRQNMATQDLLVWIKEEILSTTRLPMAMDYLAAELKLHGMFSPAMAKLAHYFAPFQTYVIAEAENERGTVRYRRGPKNPGARGEISGRGSFGAGTFSLPIRVFVPQSVRLRSRIGSDCRRPDFRRRLARMDSNRAAAGRT